MALAMLSTYSARRLAKALAEKDIHALTQVSGVGKKTAERIILELSDKVEDLAIGPEGEARRSGTRCPGGRGRAGGPGVRVRGRGRRRAGCGGRR